MRKTNILIALLVCETFGIGVFMCISIFIVLKYDSLKRMYSETISSLRSQKNSNLNFSWPASGKVVLKPTWYHMAVDIEDTSFNAPIKAAQMGKVILSNCADNINGCSIIIDHKNGYFTLYAHNKQNEVKPGELVEKGQEIGIMGTTGSEKNMGPTPLVHFELFEYIKGSRTLLNPLPYFPEIKNDIVSSQ